MRSVPIQKPFGAQSPRPAGPSGIRPALFYGMFGLLLATNVATGVAFLMAPDISRLMGDQTDLIVSAYEDRIATMRLEVDRLHSRQFAQAGDLNLQLQELAQQQEVLTEQHHYVRQLAARAEELGLRTAAAPSTGVDPLITGSVSATGQGDVLATARSVTTMLEESRLAMAAISVEARRSTDAIVSELQSLGLGTSLPGTAGAMGGPLLPARPGEDAGDLIEDANAVADALARYKAARKAIATAPIHRPIAASARSSSGFGNRTDPFTRGKAFHAGLDFAAPTGTVVTSAGDGRVSFVGVRSGYGKVVEVTHSDGLVTRYAHLSAFIAREGQSVQTGTPIAKVGSTGRSTGPHLHFEVRKADRPLDPSRFLAAGRRLARLVGTPA
ncbi:Peptidase family M23 [Devosia enhydra]|uniref:Peptidase family M23 n=1 Tax=Devosia enhydra TaxID=665118 RepID=A0A1K2HVE4_9HYPH|nr:M23 family metallopeptidase [Devosia enhydra]SFZ82697.1 Peptidase family M23 [Devosia enhydra]